VFSDYDLVLLDKLGIDEVTKEAFSVLGNNSQIIAANHYSCTECSQEYKKTADTLNDNGPALASGSGGNIPQQADILSASTSNDNMEVDKVMMTMAVLDSLVIGLTYCAYEDCTIALANAQGGVFCAFHNMEYGAKCHVHGCTYQKIDGTEACNAHHDEWMRYKNHSNWQRLSGFR